MATVGCRLYRDIKGERRKTSDGSIELVQKKPHATRVVMVEREVKEDRLRSILKMEQTGCADI